MKCNMSGPSPLICPYVREDPKVIGEHHDWGHEFQELERSTLSWVFVRVLNTLSEIVNPTHSLWYSVFVIKHLTLHLTNSNIELLQPPYFTEYEIQLTQYLKKKKKTQLKSKM